MRRVTERNTSDRDWSAKIKAKQTSPAETLEPAALFRTAEAAFAEWDNDEDGVYDPLGRGPAVEPSA
jgi:hypothetical protein